CFSSPKDHGEVTRSEHSGSGGNHSLQSPHRVFFGNGGELPGTPDSVVDIEMGTSPTPLCLTEGYHDNAAQVIIIRHTSMSTSSYLCEPSAMILLHEFMQPSYILGASYRVSGQFGSFRLS